MSAATLAHLGTHFNRTAHRYVAGDGSQREYLLDVNPWIRERERGDGMNVIDARWIDVRNGLFVDITGLSETHPDTLPGVWSCKNYHRYRTTDLYPMRESVFEGVPVKVPYSYNQILIQEYRQKALVYTEYEGWVLWRCSSGADGPDTSGMLHSESGSSCRRPWDELVHVHLHGLELRARRISVAGIAWHASIASWHGWMQGAVGDSSTAYSNLIMDMDYRIIDCMSLQAQG